MDDQTDVSAVDTSSTDSSTSIFGKTLDDLASSAVSGIGGAAVTGLSKVVSQTLAPAPDLAAKAAGSSTISAPAKAGGISIILIGGAAAAYFLMKR